MSKISSIKEMILELLADNRTHTTHEFRSEALNRGYISLENDTAVRNALHQLKQQNKIKSPEKRIYILNSTESNLENTTEFENCISYLSRTIDDINSFNWKSCSDTELSQIRNKIVILKELSVKIQSTICS